VVIIAVVALGPLAVFVPRLAALRRQGILQYGIFGQMQSTHFHEKWIHNVPGTNPNFSLLPRAALSVTSARVTRSSNS
jgi:hypothetical protein